jgi:hypothetical protein
MVERETFFYSVQFLERNMLFTYDSFVLGPNSSTQKQNN